MLEVSGFQDFGTGNCETEAHVKLKPSGNPYAFLAQYLVKLPHLSPTLLNLPKHAQHVHSNMHLGFDLFTPGALVCSLRTVFCRVFFGQNAFNQQIPEVVGTKRCGFMKQEKYFRNVRAYGSPKCVVCFFPTST